MAEDRIEIEIVLDDGSIVKGFQKVKKEAQDAGGFISSTVGASFTKLGAVIAGVGTTIAAAFASKKIIASAIEQENAINKLNTSLRLAGEFSKSASLEIQSFADAIQNTTTFSQEQAIELFALSRNFADTNEEAKKLTSAALELSVAFGTDANSAVELLAKTLNGDLGKLGSRIPELKELSKTQLEAGAALDVVLSRFGGGAASQINTFSGSIEQLKNVFDDFLGNIGQLVIKSPVIVAFVKELTGLFSKQGEAIKEAGKSTDVIGDAIIQVIKFGEAVNKFIIVPIELAFNAVKLVFDGIVLFIQTRIAVLAEVASRVVGFFSPDSELSNNLKLFAESSKLVFDDLSTSTQESLNGILDFNFTDKAAVFLEGLKNTAQSAKAITTEIKDSAKKDLEEIATVTIDISDMVKNSLKAGITQGLSAIGAALVTGKNAFKEFGKAVLGILGDFAIQMGGVLIAQGLAIDSLKVSLLTLSGGAAIAAGAALIVVGGALKALAGGGAGAATAGGGGVTSSPATSPLSEDPSESITERDTTKVAVTVQGNVFDSKETGLRIVDILNESFSSEGTVLVTS